MTNGLSLQPFMLMQGSIFSGFRNFSCEKKERSSHTIKRVATLPCEIHLSPFVYVLHHAEAITLRSVQNEVQPCKGLEVCNLALRFDFALSLRKSASTNNDHRLKNEHFLSSIVSCNDKFTPPIQHHSVSNIKHQI